MKKRVFIALAAALSVTLAAVCTAGVISSARSSEPAPSTQSSADASSSPSGETGTGLTETSAAAEAESAEKELYYASWQSLGSGTLLENAQKERCTILPPETMSDLEDLATGNYTEERLEQLRQKYFPPSRDSGWSKSKEIDRLLRYWRVWDQCETEDGLDVDAFEELWKGEKYPTYLPDAERLSERFPDLTKVQSRVLLLKTLLIHPDIYNYDTMLYLGVTSPDTPKLTPEKAKEIIAQYDGPTEGRTKAIVQEFLKVQPYADSIKKIEPFACNSRDNWHILCHVVQFVTQDDDGLCHIVGVGDDVFVFHLVQDEDGNMLDFEVLLEPEKDPFKAVMDSDTSWYDLHSDIIEMCCAPMKGPIFVKR